MTKVKKGKQNMFCICTKHVRMMYENFLKGEKKNAEKRLFHTELKMKTYDYFTLN